MPYYCSCRFAISLSLRVFTLSGHAFSPIYREKSRQSHISKRVHGMKTVEKKNEYLTLWEGRSGVMCGACGKGRCVIIISQDLILHVAVV